MGGRRLIVAAGVLTAGAVPFAGCGEGGRTTGFAAAAEPAVSPSPAVQPAGQVVEIGGEIEGLAFDPRSGTLAATTRDPGLLSVIDGRTLETRRQVEVGEGARHLQLAAPGGPVLVPAQFTDELMSVELPSGRAETVVVGESPHDAAAIGDRVFVGDEGGDTLTVVEDGEVTDTIEAPVQPGAVEAVDGLIAVVAVAERVLTVFDPRTLGEVAEVPAGVGPTHAVALNDRLFVVDTQGEAVIEYRVSREDPIPVEVARIFVAGAPYGLALDARRERLWVTSTGRNLVVELALDGSDIEEVRSYPTVQQPNTVAVDPVTGRVFVAGAVDGVVQALDPPDRNPSMKVERADGA